MSYELGRWSEGHYLRAGFFLFALLSMASGPFHCLLAPSSYPGWPGIGQCLPDLHLLQLSDGGISTTFCSLPYFLRGTSLARARRDLLIAENAEL